MATKQQRDLAEWILGEVGTVNPYNRSQSNLRSEYYIYQGGFLAGFLASLMQEDPNLIREFKQHIKSKRG